MIRFSHNCVFLSVLFIISICVWLTVSNSSAAHTEKLSNLEIEGELIFVHLLYRHGDRTPVYPAPGSKYSDISYWPEGWGQLTSLGIQQEFALGQWLRRRYGDFLNSTYNVNDIYVQSSDVDRTLMSAQSVLAGLYPPFGTKIWNRNVLWQPIPVHTVPVSMDPLIAGQVNPCPSFEHAVNRYLNSDEIIKFQNSIQHIYDYVSLNTGTQINSFDRLMILRDAWLCESAHNYTLPDWVTNLYPDNDEFHDAALKYYHIPTGTKFMAKFMSGFLLRDILDRFRSKMQNSLSPNRKIWMYSSHDSTVFSFLKSLGISDKTFVPYAAAITIEMRKHEDEYYVQIFYKNSIKNPEAIYIPECGTACPLAKMYDLYDDIIPKNDFQTECLIPEIGEVNEVDIN